MMAIDTLELTGLRGDNPLGFLAALGVMVSLRAANSDHRLYWTDGSIPVPVLSPARDVHEIADLTRAVADDWLQGPALDADVHPKLQIRPPALREYLQSARQVGSQGVLAGCLLAEDSLDNGGKAKPSDLYFLAGQQKFVSVARSILSQVTYEQLTHDMVKPWAYKCDQPSLMWDSTDDRHHALSGVDPTNSALNPKLTNPGAEALAHCSESVSIRPLLLMAEP